MLDMSQTPTQQLRDFPGPDRFGCGMIAEPLIAVEVCAGAGGQAIGLEAAGFDHAALVEIDEDCRRTLKLNRPHWNIADAAQSDICAFDGRPFRGVDLLSGGLPCPPFSVAGKQLGEADERNLFPAFLRLVDEIRPRAIMVENVRGFLDPRFAPFRNGLQLDFQRLGYRIQWRLLQAADFGVPQLRPRVVIVGMRDDLPGTFKWPAPLTAPPPSVGQVLEDLMAAGGWVGASDWATQAGGVAPTLVGGSRKHGGPDLGPTRARRAWAAMGVDGRSVVQDPPGNDHVGMPRLTVRMTARLQGFPDTWQISGRRTAAYRQVGNAFPPPVARAVAEQIAVVLRCSAISAVA